MLLLKDETASTVSLLEEVASFAAEFVYDNRVYCFAGIMLERFVGESLGSFTQRNKFNPLRLSHRLQDFRIHRIWQDYINLRR